MGRIRRLILVALGAAVLGLAASMLAGAQVRRMIATATLDGPAGHQRAAAHPVARPPSSAAVGSDETGTVRVGVDSHASSAPPPGKRRRARGRRTPAAALARDTFLDELGRGITKRGEGRYQLRSSTLSLALANLRGLDGAVRVAPEVRDGKSVGFRLAWVKPDGPIAKLGLRSGDVLVSVNGLDLATPDHVLDAYGKLEAARRFVLGVLREGRQSTYEYAIR